MKKHILITGGTGFIGAALIKNWLELGHNITVLSRNPARGVRLLGPDVTFVREFSDVSGQVDWIINLAGEGIADQRWSERRKIALRESRIALTERLVRWVIQSDQRPELFISGSAIGYYGSVSSDIPSFTEDSTPGSGFAASLCIDWEYAVQPLQERCERVVIVRTGVVLGEHGGMLKRLWLPFNAGLGGMIGSGSQMLSWIHRDDYVKALDFIIQSELTGPVNMTTPYPVSNSQFTSTLAAVLKRPAIFPMPAFIARLLFGEMSELLLEGQKVMPSVLVEHGFKWMYPNVREALSHIADEW